MPAVDRQIGPLSKGDEEVPVGNEHDPRAEVFCRIEPWRHAPDDLNVLEPRGPLELQACAGERGAIPVRSWFGEREVDGPVLGELRQERHVEQSSLVTRIDLGHTREWLGPDAVRCDDSESARSLRHEHPAIGGTRPTKGARAHARRRGRRRRPQPSDSVPGSVQRRQAFGPARWVIAFRRADPAIAGLVR